MMLFRWEEIDHSLARLRLTQLSIEMNQLIRADASRIRFEQRGNMNRNTVPSLLLKTQQGRADEWAQKTYEIYCDVWQKQGNEKSAAFLRAVFAHGIYVVLRGRGGAIKSDFTQRSVRTAFPTALTQAYLLSRDLNMRRMEDHWRRRIEIEAKEIEHAHRISKSRPPIPTNGQRSHTANASGVQDLNRRPVAGSEQSVPAIGNKNRTKPGPRPIRSESFVVCAGTMWRKAISDARRVSRAQLAHIASKLDAAKHLPPADYLEDRYAQEVKAFNSRHSRSTGGPLITWSLLVANGDKDHLQGMRRLLSRCASTLGAISDIRS